MIRDASHVDRGFDARVEVCVIGSGAGGGVAAGVLAEGGREVLVLEEGSRVPKGRMNQRAWDMYPLLYRDGGNQVTSDAAVNVMQGRALGGTTVVNMADVVPIPEPVHTWWARHHGLTRYGFGELEAAAAACSEAIQANPIPEGLVNRANRALLEGGRALGIAGGVFENNRVGCVGSGFCVVGCAYDAKRSVALTWVPRALETGRATFQTDARVERLHHRRGRVVAATGSVIDPETGRTLAPFRVEADEFVLSAGTIHSPLLLLDSGLGGRAAGRNLSLQPQAPLTALFPDEVIASRGVPQSAYLDGHETRDPDAGLGGYRLEGNYAPPAMMAIASGLFGQEAREVMARFRHAAFCLCLVPDQPSGRVRRDRRGRKRIDYPLTRPVRRTLGRALHTAARVYLAAGAEVVYLPIAGARPVRAEADLEQLARLPVRPGGLPLVSAHPQGTCRMGPSPRTSVVDPALKVHGIENLRVMDASVFPTSASTHTMMPTMTYAWLAARDMLA